MVGDQGRKGISGWGAGAADASVCRGCSPGSFASNTGSSACIGCAAGTYGTGSGLSSCVKCLAGTFSTVSAATSFTSCIACNPGSFSTALGHTSQCSACVVATYASAAGATACTVTVMDTFQIRIALTFAVASSWFARDVSFALLPAAVGAAIGIPANQVFVVSVDPATRREELSGAQLRAFRAGRQLASSCIVRLLAVTNSSYGPQAAALAAQPVSFDGPMAAAGLPRVIAASVAVSDSNSAGWGSEATISVGAIATIVSAPISAVLLVVAVWLYVRNFSARNHDTNHSTVSGRESGNAAASDNLGRVATAGLGHAVCVAKVSSEASPAVLHANSSAASELALVSTASYGEMAEATGDFDATRIVGRGGFGPVYRGAWQGRAVAVKALDGDSMQGMREFLREVQVLGRYRHPNLVPLLAYCHSTVRGRPAAFLVYPLFSRALNRALAESRQEPGGACPASRPLAASARLSLAVDITEGLAFLHDPGGRLPSLLHRDVKSSNVLLDDQDHGRISDVGLARPAQAGESTMVTTMAGMVGTFGYIDPEYMRSGEFTASCDIYSLGVVYLELLTGLPANESSARPPTLAARMLAAGLPNRTPDVADVGAAWALPTRRGGAWAAAMELAGLALRCIHADVSQRPAMKELLYSLRLLDSRAEAPASAAALPAATGPAAAASECVICMSEPRRARLLPCCHVLLCAHCALVLMEPASGRGLTNCPTCRAGVEGYDEGDFQATFMPQRGPAGRPGRARGD